MTRVGESNLVRVRNVDGFTGSILRRIEREGLDTAPADLSQLSAAVEGAIERLVEDQLVSKADFAHPLVVAGLRALPDRDATDVRRCAALLTVHVAHVLCVLRLGGVGRCVSFAPAPGER